MATDPVCKMQIEEKQAAAKVEYAGQMYHFCSETCHKTFTADPQKYASVPPHGSHGGSHRHGHS